MVEPIQLARTLRDHFAAIACKLFGTKAGLSQSRCALKEFAIQLLHKHAAAIEVLEELSSLGKEDFKELLSPLLQNILAQ